MGLLGEPCCGGGQTDDPPPVVRLCAESVEEVAQRLCELLGDRPAPLEEGLIDAAEVARRHGVSRPWVYRNAATLGVIRLGEGPRPAFGSTPAGLPSE